MRCVCLLYGSTWFKIPVRIYGKTFQNRKPKTREPSRHHQFWRQTETIGNEVHYGLRSGEHSLFFSDLLKIKTYVYVSTAMFLFYSLLLLFFYKPWEVLCLFSKQLQVLNLFLVFSSVNKVETCFMLFNQPLIVFSKRYIFSCTLHVHQSLKAFLNVN